MSASDDADSTKRTASSALEMRNVMKSFGKQRALCGIDVTVGWGSIFGLLGPNGSGKTTAMRIALGLISPDSGSVHINGQRPSRRANCQVGYAPEERGMYSRMRVRDAAIFFAKVKNASQPREVADRWVERLQLAKLCSTRIGSLSKGNVRKLQILAAVVGSPQLLILDEPFSGLDPINVELVMQILEDFRGEGKSVIVSMHDMARAESLCDYVQLISRGKTLLSGAVSSLVGPDSRVAILFKAACNDNFGKLAALGGVSEVALHRDEITVCLSSGEVASRVLGAIQELYKIERYEIRPLTLHELFVLKVEGGSAKE